MFIDKAAIIVQGGWGGDGCQSFARSKFQRYGKPNGGDGGDGGSVILRTDWNITTLLDFQYRRHFKADRGGHGSSNNKAGARGTDTVVHVPAGTVVYDRRQDLLLRDLASAGETVTVAHGGKGGRGNARFRHATKGEAGEELELELELKTIADIGIIGYPNAGKSSLLSVLSNAHPKVADYAFTTKSPNLGVMEEQETRLVIADIPGLIEDAHKGRGLGHDFLRHIERTLLLIHLVDVSNSSKRDCVKDFHLLNKELKFYNPLLLKKPQMIVANKIDLEGAHENVKRLKAEIKKPVIAISCKDKTGIADLKDKVFQWSHKHLKGLS